MTEIGGLLSHGAVVAREFGLPCVVNVGGACGGVRTGQRVRVDGAAGTVEVLDAPYDFRFKGVSVFIEVGTPAFARARAALARTLGPTHAPSFAAHVTLLYGIDPSAYGGAASVLATLRRACARAAPFELAVARGRFEGGWKFGDYAPFDMRFLQIEYEEAPGGGGALAALHGAASALFPGTASTSASGTLLPHASLLYLRAGDARFTKDDAARLVAEEAPALLRERVPVRSVALWSTEGPPSAWRRLGEVPLGGGGGGDAAAAADGASAPARRYPAELSAVISEEEFAKVKFRID